MSINIQSSLSLSLKQLVNKRMLKIFFLHFFLTFTIAGVIVFFFNEYFLYHVEKIVSDIFNFFSSSDSNENIISYIARTISYIISWFIFIYILIPTSTITGLIFEETIFNKIIELRKINFTYKKIQISIIYICTFAFKNFLVYLILNLIAIPFYLSLPGINIFIFLVLNGYILGVQTYKGIILSYFDQPKVRKLIAQNKFDIFILGAFLTFIYLIPLINFFAPLFTILIFLNYFILNDYK